MILDAGANVEAIFTVATTSDGPELETNVRAFLRMPRLFNGGAGEKYGHLFP